MVQIIQEKKRPTFLQELGVVGKELFEKLPGYLEKRKFAELNPELAGLSEQYQKMGLESKLRQQEQVAKLAGEKELIGEDYNTIKNAFGQQFADLWKSAPTGGKTKLLETAIDASLRGQDVNELLSQSGLFEAPEEISERISSKEIETPKAVKFVDFDKGLTPKERAKREEDRYAKNLPLYQDLQKKREGLDAEADSLEILQDLSPQIGIMERLNINPKSGELILPALASKEAQRFSKTINDFTTKAKDTYGARVTNFELDRFMKRLPTLANSEEGRESIIRQMQIINEINKVKNDELNHIIDESGGIRKIDYDQAERMAEKSSKSKIDQLKKEFKNLDSSLDKMQVKRVDELKKITPRGKVAVERADGTSGYIDSSKVKDFLKIQGNKLL